MNTTLRNHAAAALLLLPAAAAFLPATVGAQPIRAVVAEPAIASVTVLADHGLADGSTVRFQLLATPGARQPRITMGSSNVVVNLRETSPGVYEGRHVVRIGERHDPRQQIVARVDFGRGAIERSFSYPASFHAIGPGGRDGREARDDRRDRGNPGFGIGPGRRDMQPPQISELTPRQGERSRERGRTEISARLSDNRSGVNPASVRLFVDGRDVTADARIDTDSIRFRDDLERGVHRAQLVVSDNAGNTSRRSWSFEVRGDRRGGWRQDRQG